MSEMQKPLRTQKLNCVYFENFVIFHFATFVVKYLLFIVDSIIVRKIFKRILFSARNDNFYSIFSNLFRKSFFFTGVEMLNE